MLDLAKSSTQPTFRHPEVLAKRAIASRLLPTCALWCRSRVNPRSVGDGPGGAAILRDASLRSAPQDDGEHTTDIAPLRPLLQGGNARVKPPGWGNSC